MNVKEEYIKTYHKEIDNYYDLMNIIQGKGDFKDLRAVSDLVLIF